MPEMKTLLQNEWEFYDEQKQKRKKMGIVIPLIFIIFILLFVVMHFVIEIFGMDIGTIFMEALITFVLVILIAVIVFVKVKDLDQDKRDWYFAVLQDKSLNHETMLGMMRKFLENNKYQYKQEETKRTIDLFITYFDVPSSGFKTRVWFTKLAGMQTLEIGIGPETPLNKNLIEKLKKQISSEFKKKYGQ